VKPIKVLDQFWVTVSRVPRVLRSFLQLWAVGSIIGATQKVDMAHLRATGEARILVAVFNPKHIPKLADVCVIRSIYRLHFKVEEVAQEETFNPDDDDLLGESDKDLGGADQEMEDADGEDPKLPDPLGNNNNSTQGKSKAPSQNLPPQQEASLIKETLDLACGQLFEEISIKVMMEPVDGEPNKHYSPLRDEELAAYNALMDSPIGDGENSLLPLELSLTGGGPSLPPNFLFQETLTDDYAGEARTGRSLSMPAAQDADILLATLPVEGEPTQPGVAFPADLAEGASTTPATPAVAIEEELTPAVPAVPQMAAGVAATLDGAAVSTEMDEVLVTLVAPAAYAVAAGETADTSAMEGETTSPAALAVGPVAVEGEHTLPAVPAAHPTAVGAATTLLATAAGAAAPSDLEVALVTQVTPATYAMAAGVNAPMSRDGEFISSSPVTAHSPPPQAKVVINKPLRRSSRASATSDEHTLHKVERLAAKKNLEHAGNSFSSFPDSHIISNLGRVGINLRSSDVVAIKNLEVDRLVLAAKYKKNNSKGYKSNLESDDELEARLEDVLSHACGNLNEKALDMEKDQIIDLSPVRRKKKYNNAKINNKGKLPKKPKTPSKFILK
jgi:hypothetical protein